MSKSFQERLKSLEKYRADITFKDGAFILRIKFKEGWKAVMPEDPKVVAYSEDDNRPGLHWYVSEVSNAEKVLDLIDQTILVNQEVEKKHEFFKEKVNELKELVVSDISYDKLLTLKFVISDDSTKSKRGRKKAKKQVVEHVQADDGTVVHEESENAAERLISTDDNQEKCSDENVQLEPSIIDMKIAEAIGD